MRFCSGRVRISLIYDHKTEEFVVGMALRYRSEENPGARPGLQRIYEPARQSGATYALKPVVDAGPHNVRGEIGRSFHGVPRGALICQSFVNNIVARE